MKCFKCGTEVNKEGISFCPTCGAYLKQVQNVKDNEFYSYDNDDKDMKREIIVGKPIDEDNNNKKKKLNFISRRPVAVVRTPIKGKRVLLAMLLLGVLVTMLYMIVSGNANTYFFVGTDGRTVETENPSTTDPEPTTTTPEPDPEPEPQPQPDPEPEPQPDPQPDPEPEPQPQPDPTPTTNACSSLTAVSKSNYNGVRASSEKTTIIYDNQYYKQIKVTGKQQVLDIISCDSTNQKNRCSSNVASIENNIINNYGITAVNLCEMDYNFALELQNVIDYIYRHYPNARNRLTNITLANLETQNVIAAFKPIFTFVTSEGTSNYPIGLKMQILLNSKYFLNSNTMVGAINNATRSGFYPPNANRTSALAHEFGHYLSYIALMKHYDTSDLTYVPSSMTNTMFRIYNDFQVNEYSKAMLEEAYSNFVRDNGALYDFDTFRATISKYAMAKDDLGKYIYDETIAEAFHDVYLNGANAKPASRYIIAVLESHM